MEKTRYLGCHFSVTVVFYYNKTHISRRRYVFWTVLTTTVLLFSREYRGNWQLTVKNDLTKATLWFYGSADFTISVNFPTENYLSYSKQDHTGTHWWGQLWQRSAMDIPSNRISYFQGISSILSLPFPTVSSKKGRNWLVASDKKLERTTEGKLQLNGNNSV